MRPLNANMNGSWCPSNTHPHQHQQQLHHSLKINKESHIIKKPSSATSSSSSSSLSQGSQGASPPAPPPPPPPPPHPPKPQQRPPVIIYTHSPKIIHTHPKDFMALVQKLTGMSRSDQEADDPHHGATDNKKIDVNVNNGNFMISRNPQGNNRPDPIKVMGSNHEDNESMSGITTNEDMFSNGGSDNGQVNSNCIGAPSMSYHQDHPTSSFMGNMNLPHYTGGSNNSNNNHSNNSYNELLCCGGRSDPTYDFIDFNMPFN